MVPDVGNLGFTVTVGIAVVGYMIWMGKKQQTFMEDLIRNHLDRNTAAFDRLNAAVTKLINLLNKRK